MTAFVASAAVGHRSFLRPRPRSQLVSLTASRRTAGFLLCPRANASPGEPQQTTEGLFMDDPFGGFKGQRRSDTSDSWSKAGTRVKMNEKQDIFVSVRGADESRAVDVLVFPGFPCPSFLTRNFADRLAFLQPNARISAIDWPGVGESSAPQDGIGGVSYGVEYSLKAGMTVASNFGIGGESRPPAVVVGHGWLGTRVAAEVAKAIGASAVVLLAPVLGSGGEPTQLPKELRKLRNPLVGPLLTGNPAHMADKVFSSATPYGFAEEDMMALRAPFLQSGGPGFAARATALNVDWKRAAVEARDAVAALDCPLTIATAEGDRWLNNSKLKAELDGVAAERGEKITTRIDWEYSGHFIFDDAPEDTAELVGTVVSGVI